MGCDWLAIRMHRRMFTAKAYSLISSCQSALLGRTARSSAIQQWEGLAATRLRPRRPEGDRLPSDTIFRAQTDPKNGQLGAHHQPYVEATGSLIKLPFSFGCYPSGWTIIDYC